MSSAPQIVATRTDAGTIRVDVLNWPAGVPVTLYRADGYRASFSVDPIVRFTGDQYFDSDNIDPQGIYKYAAAFDNAPIGRYFEIIEDHSSASPFGYFTVEPLDGVTIDEISEVWTWLGVPITFSFLRVVGGTFEGRLGGETISIGINQSL